MENGNKAIIMAASTLLALMLFAIFTYFIKTISAWPQAQDELLSTEQKAKFNEEYEVYEKSAMYGVDVISCLNKAKSNNEKYVAGDNFLSGDAYGSKYRIDVVLTIKTKLTESIEVRAMNEYNKEIGVFTNQKVKKEDTPSSTFISLADAGFKIDRTKMLTSWDGSEDMCYNMQSDAKSLTPNKEYRLLGDGADELVDLLAHSNEPRQNIKNKINNNLQYVDGVKFGWSSATWTTYLYSLKLKKFKCDGIEYDADTGLVKEIRFIELN